MKEATKLARVVRDRMAGTGFAPKLHPYRVAIGESVLLPKDFEHRDRAEQLSESINAAVSALLQSGRAKVRSEDMKLVCDLCARDVPYREDAEVHVWELSGLECGAEAIRARAREEK